MPPRVHWCKVAHNLDVHPKIRRAGNLGRQVFEFALRRNADPENEVAGELDAELFEADYLADALMLEPEDAARGLEACLAGRRPLLRRVAGAERETIAIVGWDTEWGKGSLTEAERKRLQRARAKEECPDNRPDHDRTRPDDRPDQTQSQNQREIKTKTQKNTPPSPLKGGDGVSGQVRRSRKAQPLLDQLEPDRRGVVLRVLERLSARGETEYRGANAHVRLLCARLDEGYTEWDLRAIVGYCASDSGMGFASKSDMRKYLRPETLFGRDTVQRYAEPARAWGARSGARLKTEPTSAVASPGAAIVPLPVRDTGPVPIAAPSANQDASGTLFNFAAGGEP